MTVTPLSSVKTSAPMQMNEDALLKRVYSFLTENNLIELPFEDDWDDYLELEWKTETNEQVGKLNELERRAFQLARIVEGIVKDVSEEHDEEVRKFLYTHQRTYRVSQQEAFRSWVEQNGGNAVPKEVRVEMNMLSASLAMLDAMWSFALRTRLLSFSEYLAVQPDYSVWSHSGSHNG